MRAQRLLRVARGIVAAAGIVGLAENAWAQLPQDGSPRPGWSDGFFTNVFVESSPVIGPDDTVYVAGNTATTASRGRMWAIQSNGTPKWPAPHFFEAEAEIYGSAAMSPDGRTLYFGSWDGRLYALDTATGQKKWHFVIDVDAPTIIVNGSPAIGSDGTIYFGSSDVDFTRPGALHALVDEGTRGRPLWPQFRVPGGVEGTPAIGSDGTIYFGAVDSVTGGRIYAVRPDGLSEKWPSVPTNGLIRGSPSLAADGTLYIGTYVGGVHAVSPAGAIKWVFNAGSVEATPTLGADGTIYVGSIDDLKFYAVTPDGREKWSQQFPQGSQVFTSAAVRGDGSVIFAVNALSRSTVYGFDAAGNKLFERERNGLIYSSPAVAPDGTIYFGAYDRRLHSLHGSGSPLSVISNWPMFGRDLAHTNRVPPPTDTRLLNLSTRAAVGAGANLIAGFAVRGSATKRYLIRGIGPSLAPFGVSNPLADPTITLRAFPSSVMLAFNDDWQELPPPNPSVTQTAASVGAFPLPPSSKDAVVLPSLAPGLYTAEVGTNDGGVGTALVEAYDPTPDEPNADLINLSTRGRVAVEPLIPGFVIRGTRPLRVLVRAVGPGLLPHGVSGVLQRPVLKVFAREQQIEREIAANTNWTTSPLRADIAAAAALSGAFPLSTTGPNFDSATVLSLTPGPGSLGQFTIQVSGEGGTTGEVLVEIYVLP